jgi:cytochrome c556
MLATCSEERRETMFRMRTFMRAMPIAALLSALGAASAFAGPIEERQALMKEDGKAGGELFRMFKGEAAYDATTVKKDADLIVKNLEKMAALFPPGSDKGPPETWAKAEIWTDAEGFKAAGDAAYNAAKALAASTDEASFKAAVPALGQACGGCHEKFRKPKG